MKKPPTIPEASSLNVRSAAYVANTTPRKMRAHLRQLHVPIDPNGEFSITALLYAIRLKADPVPFVPTPAMERKVDKVFRRITQAAFAPR